MVKPVLKENETFVEKLAARQTVLGVFVVSGEAAVSEILGYAGFDFIVIDTEHSPNDNDAVLSHIRAAEISGLTAIVRVTKNDPSLILRALDNGAGGVLVPQVNTAEEARQAVRAARYTPAGERGIAGVVRAARYGFIPMNEYLSASVKKVQVIVQVEHIDAVKNLDEILAVDGVDGIFIGPTDLSQSMGITGQFNNPVLRDTISSIINRVKATDKWLGIFCINSADAKDWESKGVPFLAMGTDTMLFAQAARDIVRQMK